jgi:hypothetical protein
MDTVPGHASVAIAAQESRRSNQHTFPSLQGDRPADWHENRGLIPFTVNLLD